MIRQFIETKTALRSMNFFGKILFLKHLITFIGLLKSVRQKVRIGRLAMRFGLVASDIETSSAKWIANSPFLVEVRTKNGIVVALTVPSLGMLNCQSLSTSRSRASNC
jgi:hypothetical protein